MNSITLTSQKKLSRDTTEALQTLVNNIDDFEDMLLGFHMQKSAHDSTVPLDDFLKQI